MYSKIFLEAETNQKPTWKLGRWHKALFLYIEIVEERKMMLSQQDDSTTLAWIVPFYFCVLNGIVTWTVILFLCWWCLYGVLNISVLQKLASKSFCLCGSCWCQNLIMSMCGLLTKFQCSIWIWLCRETISSFDLTTWVKVDDQESNPRKLEMASTILSWQVL